MEPKTAPPHVPPPPSVPEDDDDEDPVVPDVEKVRGLPWASNLGVAVAGLGLALVAYAYYWEALQEGAFFEPAGVSGLYLGLGIMVVGLVAAIVLVVAPVTSRTPVRTPLDRATWLARADESWRRRIFHRVAAWIGAAAFLMGLAFVAWVYRENVAAGADADGLSVMGAAASYSQWATAGIVFALIGVFVWALSSVQAGMHGRTAEGYRVAAVLPALTRPVPDHPPAITPRPGNPAPVAAAPPKTAPAAPAVTQGVLSNGVREAEVRALMRRIDQMMATLPEDTVTAFSKSPEAGTYLKLLGDAKP